ncbi:CocE/NonD family hydrolase [Paenarthrobacter sp. NPDC058040]|uniref:CocE/NonD family hydrolase n=1 Tax=unclassified Paenarthrobacter TaxID=2634190 RepID=UPI0036DD60A8
MIKRQASPAQVAGPPPSGRATRRHNLMVPMRDGVELALDVLLPDGEGPFPTVLVRTCYDKNRHIDTPRPVLQALLGAGYAIAAQDVRGRFNSDGRWGMYFAEFDDGFDTLEWLAGQPWCDGNIGMYGVSYEASVQWFAARSGSEHLKAIVPIAATPSSMWNNEPLRGGAFLAPMVQYAVDMGYRSFQSIDFGNTLWAEDRPSSMALPFADVPAAQGSQSPWIAEMLQHPTLDEFWARGDFSCWDQIRTPALHITGWWDMNLPGALDNYPGMRAGAATAEARDGQRLIIGPWPHWMNNTRQLNGVDFGDQAIIDLDGHIVEFFDRHLKGVQAAPDEDPVHVFVIGANEWWASDQWPLAEGADRELFLSSDGSANSLHGDGGLTWESPGDSPADEYDYDPLNPVHAFFHMCADGPVDDRIPSQRPDVLCYTTAALDKDIDVVGPVLLRLWAASSATDTDWHARLVDVHPDGSARYLCHGVLRARFRDGFTTPALLEPDRPYEYEIPMDAVGIRFGVGHRIRLEITSSWSPRYDRNTNTGADNPFQESRTVVAHQTILHDAEHPSRLVVQVVERDADQASAPHQP